MAANLPMGRRRTSLCAALPPFLGFIVEVPKSHLHLISATLKPKITTTMACEAACAAIPSITICLQISAAFNASRRRVSWPHATYGTVISSDSISLQFANYTRLRS